MQAQLVELLSQTLEGKSVHEAEQKIYALRLSPDFVTTLVSIVASGEVPDAVRRQALICLKLTVSNSWNEIPEASQAYALQSLPAFLQHLPYRSILASYSRTLIRNAFFGAKIWSNLPETIKELLTGNRESVVAGFLLTLALCGELKSVDKDVDAFTAEFSTTILSLWMPVFAGDDLELLELAFHCAYRCLIARNVPVFETPGDIAFEIVKMSLRVADFYRKDDVYCRYAIQTLKFSAYFVQKCAVKVGNPELLASYMQVVKSMFEKDLPTKVRCLVVKLLAAVLNVEKLVAGDDVFLTWSLIESDIPSFVRLIMGPLFALTRDECETFCTDQVQFVSEIHKIASSFEDLRAEAASIMHKFSDHEELTETARMIAMEALAAYGNNPNQMTSVALFSAFLLFASVSSAENAFDRKRLDVFFQAIAPLFECPDNLARCAAFMILANTKILEAEPAMAVVCVQHLMDPCPAIQYYAAVATSQLLGHTDNQQEVRAGFIDVVPKLFESVLRLTQDFSHDEIAGAVVMLVNIFSNEILPMASDLAQELLRLLADASEDNEIDKAMGILSSFDTLIEVVTLNGKARSMFGAKMFLAGVEALKVIKVSQLFDSLVLPVFNCLHWSEFVPDFWQAAAVIMERVLNDDSVAVSDLLDIISELLVKDSEFAGRQDLAASLGKFTVESLVANIEKPDKWNEFAKVAASLMMRLGGEHPITQCIMEQLPAMIADQIVRQEPLFIEKTGLVIALNVAMIINFQKFSAVLGDKMGMVLEFWLEIPMFPETVVATMQIFPAFAGNRDMQMKILFTVTGMLCGDILTRSKDDGDTFDEEADSSTPYIWFDFGETLNKFCAFLGALESGAPDVFKGFVGQLQEEDEDVMTYINQLPVVANWYAETKAMSML